MKKTLNLEQRLLLAESGELSPEGVAALERELAANPRAAAQREEMRLLLGAAAAALPSGRPSAQVLARVHAAAAATPVGQRGLRILPRPVLMQVLAYAAALVVALSAWLVVGMRGGAPDRIAEMHALVVVAGESDAATEQGLAADSDADASLRALASQLLALEGMTPEEFGTADAGDDEEATPAGAPSPTALQPRSTVAPAAGKYG